MNKLNKKVEYALMALKYMTAKPAGSLTTAKEVVTSTEFLLMPRPGSCRSWDKKKF